MNRKILMFESKKLCYGSSGSFLHLIGNELVKCGYEVEFFVLEEGKEDELEAYINHEYAAVFDVNSIITNAVLDDNVYFLDTLKSPFYNLIVDHPMHLHDRLSVALQNYNIICVDKDHCEYIMRRYPNINNVIYMPFAGTLSRKSIPYEDRKYDILFPGTYVPPEQYRERLVRQNPKLLEIAMKAHEILTGDDTLTFEDAVWKADSIFMESIDGKLELLSNVDRFVRTLIRIEAIEMLLDSGRTITVAGENWLMYDRADEYNLNILPACSYGKMLELVADSRMVFNNQPLFMYGSHDRVFNAAVNGAVPFTDCCRFLEDNFTDNEDIVLYRRSQMEKIPERLNREFEDTSRLKKISQNAEKNAISKHTWENRIHIITDVMER